MAGLAHLGFGFAAKRFAPKVPLAVLLICSIAIDLLYLFFWLIGIEKSGTAYWSHSLFMAAVWSAATAGVAALFSRKVRTAIVIGLLVFSHWMVDFIVWPMSAIYPDATGMPLFFEGSPIVGLGLYNSLIPVIIGEAGMVILGVVIYVFALRKIKKNARTGTEGKTT
jgi:hypothetical protein